MEGKRGPCGAGPEPVIHHAGPHFGEEPPISGRFGSGTVFFSGCPMRCVYCQNHPWSQVTPLAGNSIDRENLARLFLKLQASRCHNINLVTPEPWIPWIVPAIGDARRAGLRIPVVYNTSGFITVESLHRIRECVEIFLTDIRYESPMQAAELSGSPEYFHSCRDAAKIMFDLAGPLRLNPDGIAERGTIIRVLVLPSLIRAAESCLRFIAENFPPGIHVSLMGQYEPVHHARNHTTLCRQLSSNEYREILQLARRLGITAGWRQTPGPVPHGLLGTEMMGDIVVD